jgi:LmbE family N-acetylglucosaminyl deacetylase
MNFGRTLVIAPHADDEVIWCGGTIALIGGVDIVVVAGSGQERTDDAVKAAEILGANDIWFLFENSDMMLDSIQVKDIVSKLDWFIARCYDTIIYPYRGHSHQDHRITEVACTAALRAGVQNRPTLALGYGGMKENVGLLYVDISDTINVKLEAMKCYETEVMTDPTHPRSLEFIRGKAQAYGLEAECKYAEAFNVLYWIV